jgi:hypothetical protein
MTPDRAVRELQAALHLRIDAVYDPTAAQVRSIVERWATRNAAGELVLTTTDAIGALGEIEYLFALADARAEPIVARGIAASGHLAGQAKPDPVTAWRAARTDADRFRWSVRRGLADARRRAMTQVGRVLIDAAATGRAADAVSLHLGQYADPWYAKRRDATGVLRRVTRTGARVSWPAVPGNASLPARHLMVSETITAHGHASTARALTTPGALVRWDLAPWHDDKDDCDRNAKRDVGFGPGLYPPQNVPPRPHIGCVCLHIYVNPPGVMSDG